MRIILNIGIFLTLFSIAVFGQTNQQREQIRQELREQQKQNEAFDRLNIGKSEEINPAFFELSKEAEQLIAPAQEYKTKYADFLRLPNSEIAKLFNGRCFLIGDVELSDNCKTGIPGYGNHYSFYHRRHLFSGLADIQLYNNWFVSSGFLTQGIITSLGEIELNRVSLQSGGVKFLTDFVPAETPQEADEQAEKIGNGIQDGNYFYNRAAKVEENTAYALRTIAYRSEIKLPSVYKRRDMIVIFKVISRDKDGNVTFIWRKLQDKDAPKLRTDK